MKFLKPILPIFTLIIGLFFGYRYRELYFDSKEDDNKTVLLDLKTKVIQFKRICGFLPSSLASLKDPEIEKCSSKPFISLIPKDPFDGDYVLKHFKETEIIIDSRLVGSFIKIEN